MKTWLPGGGSLLPNGAGGLKLCGWVQGMDIQVTEWVNVNNKYSDGEKTGMWARTSQWHDSEIYYCLEWLDPALFWLDSKTKKNIKNK